MVLEARGWNDWHYSLLIVHYFILMFQQLIRVIDIPEWQNHSTSEQGDDLFGKCATRSIVEAFATRFAESAFDIVHLFAQLANRSSSLSPGGFLVEHSKRHHLTTHRATFFMGIFVVHVCHYENVRMAIGVWHSLTLSQRTHSLFLFCKVQRIVVNELQ